MTIMGIGLGLGLKIGLGLGLFSYFTILLFSYELSGLLAIGYLVMG